MSDLTKDGIQLLLDTGRAQAGVLRFTSLDGKPSEPFVILPNNVVQSVAHLGAPTRVKQTVALIDAGSFCDYVNRFKNPDSLIFATVTPTGAKLTAILDYHGAPARPTTTDPTATLEWVAESMYDKYCLAVGGKAFNGDPLPQWPDFVADPLKQKQVLGWLEAARVSGFKSAKVPPAAVDKPEAPHYCNHRATLELVETDDWKQWCAADGKAMNQDTFAVWLEEHAYLFNSVKDGALKGSDLLELVCTLQATNDVRFERQQRLQDGKNNLSWTENVEVTGSSAQTGQIQFPAVITAGLQPFEGGPAYEVDARLKTRIESRKLVIWFETVQRPKIIRDSILDTVKLVTNSTGILPMIGTAA